MGFKFENEKSDSQMSLFDYQMPKADFIESKKSSAHAIDYSWMAHREPEQNKTPRFVTMSAVFHAAAILAIAVMTVPLVEQVKTETITIELEDVKPLPKIARGVKVPPTQGGTPVKEVTPVVEKIEEAGGPQDVVVAKPKSVATPKAAKTSKPAPAAKVAKAAAPKVSAKSQASTAGRSVAPKTSFQAVPMTVDDIEAPELDQGELAHTTVPSTMTEDFNEDFNNIDQSKSAALEQEKKSIAAMAASVENEQNENLNAVDAENKEEAQRLADAQNALRQKNAKAISSALESEKAAAASALAAREAAERDAAKNQA